MNLFYYITTNGGHLSYRRLDFGELRKSSVTSQGFIKADALATRTGIFKYVLPDGSIRKELRPSTEVFKHDSLQSLAQIPLTNGHPPQFLNIDNAKIFTVGFTGENVEEQGEFVKVGIVVTDKEAIDDMNGGKVELSCGYHCDLDFKEGEFKGERYDAVQKNIQYNHLAIVTKGRAGSEAKIRLDSDSAVMVNDEHTGVDVDTGKNIKLKKGSHMAKLKIDAIEYEVEDSALAQVVSNKLDALAKSEEKNEKLTGKMDALEIDTKEQLAKKDAEIEEAKKNQISKEDSLKEAKARIDLEGFAKKVLGDEFELEGKSDSEVKIAVIQKKNADFKAEEKSDAYIDGCFDSFKASFKDEKNDTDEKGDEDLKDALGKKADKAEKTDSESVRKKACEDSCNAWKQPLNEVA